MNSVGIINLGCKVNQCESDGIGKRLEEEGFFVTYELCFSDFYIINTCAVTMEAERKSRQSVSRCLKINPDAKIFVIGCASQNNVNQFSNRENVKYINGAQNKIDVISAIKSYIMNNNKDCNEINNTTISQKNYIDCDLIIEKNTQNIVKSGYADETKKDTENKEFDKNKCVVKCDTNVKYQELTSGGGERTRYYIKIQDGCNNFCSYCIVPYLRGRSRSRQIENIVMECESAEKLSNEIVLTGINLSAYGEDIGTTLNDLLGKLADIKCSIRLGSLEVNVITEEFLTAASRLKSFCPHFHLSLQSASNSVLLAMNRKYTIDEYMEKVETIRRHFPNAAITTDIIVGFPTETEQDFMVGLANIEKIKFADAHVFPYSKRDGTVAAKYKQINGQIIADRIEKTNTVIKESRNQYMKANIGKKLKVIAEEIITHESIKYIEGYSENYLRVRIPFVGDEFKKDVVYAKITLEKDGMLYGEKV